MGRHASGNVIVDKVKYPQKNGWTYLYERKRILVPETKKYKLLNKTLLGKYPPDDPCTGPPLPTRPKRKSNTSAGKAKTFNDTSNDTNKANIGNLIINGNSSAMIDIIMHVAENSGVKKELETILQDDHPGLANKILTSALYLFATDGDSWPGIQGWTRKYLGALPYVFGPISQDMLHDMFIEIGENQQLRENIFISRAKTLENEEMLALDSSTYVMETETGEILVVRNSMHKDGLIHPLLKIVFIYAIRSRKPIAYVLLPANTPDSRTVYNVVKQLGMLKLNNLELVADGGYATEEDIGYYLSEKQHFITHIESNIKWISSLIMKHRDDVVYKGEIIKDDHKFYGFTTTVTRRFEYLDPKTEIEKSIEGTINVFIYYSHYRAGKEAEYLCETYSLYEGYLLDGVALGEDKGKVNNFVQKYMHIIKNENDEIQNVVRNDKNWKEAVKLHGFIVLIADHEKDINSAFVKYRLREKIEEMVKNHKSHTGGKKIGKHKNETIEGQSFVQFQALTLRGSFEIEIKNLKQRLAVPTGNASHDTSATYKLERKVRNWLNKTSLVNILKWFDAIKKVNCTLGDSTYQWVSEYLDRDKVVLKALGLLQSEDTLGTIESN